MHHAQSASASFGILEISRLIGASLADARGIKQGAPLQIAEQAPKLRDAPITKGKYSFLCVSYRCARDNSLL
jgi:hypothetical protein